MASRILLVEDSRTQALRIKLELLRQGLDVEIAENGRAGLSAAHSRLPDAIVLDVDLPEIDGYTLCRMFKQNNATAHIPIVMLTRRDAANDALTGLEAGAEDYIPKDAYAEQNLVEALKILGLVGKSNADAIYATPYPGQ